MRRHSLLIILLSLIMLGGLVAWQINHINEGYLLKLELDKSEMQTVLAQSAVQIRKMESNDTSLRKDSLRLNQVTDSILKVSFKRFDSDIVWGYFNGLGEPITIADSNNDLQTSNLKVCMSCLLTIGLVKNTDSVTEDNIDESDFILDHTPAQMKEIRGVDEAGLDYLHILPKSKKIGLSQYGIPIAFLVGLSLLLIWLLYLNGKQSKLIKQKNEFVNHLSHQFQTPLSSIKLSANLLANKKTFDEGLISIIQKESNRLENHIKTVLHWVKADADRLQIKKNNISVTEIIERSLKQMKPVFLSNNTKVNFVPLETDYKISADENHLQLMLFNIWENAIKHNEDPVELSVSYSENKKGIAIITKDNGMGIQKDLPIEKFKGLGLAYIRRLMELHSGSLELSSSNSGLTVQLNFLNTND